jgi:hypothetical protein
MILNIILCDVDILLLCITEDHGSRVFEKRELSKMLRPKRRQVIANDKMVLKLSNKEGKTDRAFWRDGREEYSAFCSEGPKEDSHLEGLDVDGRTVLNLKK